MMTQKEKEKKKKRRETQLFVRLRGKSKNRNTKKRKIENTITRSTIPRDHNNTVMIRTIDKAVPTAPSFQPNPTK